MHLQQLVNFSDWLLCKLHFRERDLLSSYHCKHYCFIYGSGSLSTILTAQNKKHSMKDFFNKCDEIRSFLRTWSHSLKKSLIENFNFCAVLKLLTPIRNCLYSIFHIVSLCMQQAFNSFKCHGNCTPSILKHSKMITSVYTQWIVGFWSDFFNTLILSLLCHLQFDYFFWVYCFKLKFSS